MEETSLQVVENNQQSLQTVSLDQIGLLDSAIPAPIDLMSEYWSPENPGEEKRVLFDRIDICGVPDLSTGEVIDLECAFFFVKEGDKVKMIRNGSKRLVGTLQSYKIKKGTPLKIVYKGKKTNKTNQFKSDDWSIIPMTLKIVPHG